MIANPAATARRLVSGQGSNIFWGSLSLFFAAAACYFFWQNRENELAARVYRDQESTILIEREQLRSQLDKLQTNLAQFDLLLKNRDTKLKEQEGFLAAAEARSQKLNEEMRAFEMRRQARILGEQRIAQILESLPLADAASVVHRGSRPVLRVQNTALFAPASMDLTPEAKDLLRQLAQAVAPLLNHHQVRLESFTDGDPLTGSLKQKYPSSFELSGARAGVVARYLIDECGVPADKITIVSRGPTHPVQPNTTAENKAANRRLEIFLEEVAFDDEFSGA